MNDPRIGKTLLFISLLFSAVSTLSANEVSASELSDAQQLFKKKCSLCHAIDKKKLGPAVKTMSQEAETLRQAITKGRNSMPAFEGKLSSGEIAALVDYFLSQQ